MAKESSAWWPFYVSKLLTLAILDRILPDLSNSLWKKGVRTDPCSALPSKKMWFTHFGSQAATLTFDSGFSNLEDAAFLNTRIFIDSY